jgi:hypothetical protein
MLVCLGRNPSPFMLKHSSSSCIVYGVPRLMRYVYPMFGNSASENPSGYLFQSESKSVCQKKSMKCDRDFFAGIRL